MTLDSPAMTYSFALDRLSCAKPGRAGNWNLPLVAEGHRSYQLGEIWHQSSPSSKITMREESRKGGKRANSSFSSCSASWIGLSWAPMQTWSGERWEHADEGAGLERSTGHGHSYEIAHNKNHIPKPGVARQRRHVQLLEEGWDAALSWPRPAAGTTQHKTILRWLSRLENRSLLLKAALQWNRYGLNGFSPSTLCLSNLISNRRKINSFPTPGMCSGRIEAC